VLLGAPLDELGSAHIEALVANKVRESFDLDFKATLYGNGDSARRDLCGDIAALANTSGGVIVLGVEEDAHATSTGTPGVSVSDAERNRMLQVVAAGVAPMPALDVLTIATEADPGRGFYVLAVPRSTRAPHAVVVNEGFRYPVRNGTTTRYLSEPEIAAAYRERDAHAGERSAKLAAAVDAALVGVNRELGRVTKVTGVVYGVASGQG
jgi:predicted HTH transcriptional regulator